MLRYEILFLRTSNNILRIETSKIRTNVTLLVITSNVLGMLLLSLQLTLQYCIQLTFNRKNIPFLAKLRLLIFMWAIQ